MATEVAAAAANTTRHLAKEMLGVVVSAGLMDKTVKVKLGGFRWEPRVQKYFKEPRFKLVHDPRNSVRQGDIVAITPTWRVSQHVRHVVKHIIAPYGDPIDERPPIPSLEDRIAEAAAKRAAKDERRAFLKQMHTAIKDAEKIAAQVKKAIRMCRKLGIIPAQSADATTIDEVD
ncbi:nucleic acid-binding protein [Annulohypoxylon maeteangense]|uniref:nucleic acid-binding protein n=1 Tax=Annulohypoxylon maeteangense TaxID=1927788 RepID=UPI0020086D77|nr:nucleic acid-binding protein [Annulohypoxylon maeteangense]KAI0880995.1 nucleic acid-binding protein [Annulohypoxylon maeteangense]